MPANTILTPPQFALGVSAEDLVGRDTLIVDIDGTEYTATIESPSAGQYWFADRTTNTVDLTIVLAAALSIAEGVATTNGIWTTEWDHNGVVGYYRLRRTAGSAVVKLLWDHADTTAVAQWWGFSADSEAVSVEVGEEEDPDAYIAIDSVYQCGRLWLPDGLPTRWHRAPVRVGRTRFRAFNGATARFGHGGYYLWEIEVKARALMVYADRSSNAVFRRGRDGVVANDPNVSWEGGVWQWLYDTQSPLRMWESRDVLTDNTDAQIWKPKELDGLESFTDLGQSPQAFQFKMFPVEAV